MEYAEFLKSKEIKTESSGFEPTRTNPKLFEWQNDIVRWALMKGRAAIFADCGLGKTAMQLQWADEVSKHEGKPVLILAPLAVAAQTKREGLKFDVDVTVCRKQEDVKDGVNITNYEMVEHFDEDAFCGVVLDESSILKDSTSSTRKLLTDKFKNTPYKLCCTATPSPNDFMELGTHSHFLGIMTQPEMLSTFFCHDGGNTSKWRLKGHAERKFFEWVASWACCLTNPSDLGYDGSSFILPPLNVNEIIVKSNDLIDGDGQFMLLAETSQTLNERRAARRNSLNDRVKAAAEIANATDEQVLVWCDLNAESEALTSAINGAVEVKGSNTADHKESAMNGFTDGTNRVLVSKPSIAGWGMNWQQCNKMIFVGLSDSFEAYYQAVRRCWRFGQERDVNVYIIISAKEGAVKANIERKSAENEALKQNLIELTKDITRRELTATCRISTEYKPDLSMILPKWEEFKYA